MNELDSSKAGRFISLFTAARDELIKARFGLITDTPAVQTAAEFAAAADVPTAKELLEVNSLERSGDLDGALQLLETLDGRVPDEIRPVERFLRGVTLHGLRRFDEAVNAYSEAVTERSLLLSVWARANTGNIYHESKEFERAIKTYEEILSDPDVPDSGHMWHNLGAAAASIGQYQRAAEAYEMSLRLPGDNFPTAAWVNLGRAYMRLRRESEARAAFQTALTLPDPARTEHIKAEMMLEILDADLGPEALSKDDRALLEQRPATASQAPEQRILAKIQAAKQTQYDRYLQNDGSGRDNILSILRGWSSAVTLLDGSEQIWRGGGYMLKWRGKGIVIDPGFDFLRNLHDSHYHAREIDAVLVSHNHPDHNSDLGKVDDLRYELYKRRHKDPNGGVTPYTLVWDQNTRASATFLVQQPEHLHYPIVFDVGRCKPSDTLRGLADLQVSITYFPVKHGELREAVGFVLTLCDSDREVLRLGYTGDTEFFDALPDLLRGCDLLIAHISQPDEEEFTDISARKKVHLGYRGVAELIRLAEPKFTLIGEFWAGLADLRIDLVQGLRRLAGTDAILPAGIGLHVSLPTLEVECSECGKGTAFTNVRVAPPASRYGNLSYLCPSCMIG